MTKTIVEAQANMTGLSVKVTCPHCGHQNSYHNLPKPNGMFRPPELDYCDVDEGGCDKPFLVSLRCLPVQVEITTGLSLHEFYDLPQQQPITNPAQIEQTFARDHEAGHASA